ncbi:porin [Caballeronia sp. LP006]|jgi:GBP family porin|uniref:porin n=1 Tax=unclassified Caballeronia TaxID=2646786 RepID=UPI001FD51CC7|nr:MULTISPECIES: porin [unclassified Caballeronia]MDR5770886.1 porin [Caballeronia sp. LZ002]MDR5802736.1 porin [Caballeronia sp. LZ001]MDR5830615.1 porin [Caballeronia sp. LP006]MDR5846323.1 porin [Caballeronia sp. LZ003]
MKKTLIVAALSGVFATAAHAQSSVTLYGLIDAGITYTNNQNGHSNFKETSGSVNGSRWGLRGAEDLGGGLKAIFTLENGFNIANGTLGQGGREFGRQAYVGLSSEQFGTVTLGRQYDSVVDFLGPLALTGTQYGGTQFAHPFDNDNLDNTFRVNNSVKYTSANYAGFKLGAQYGFSNEAGGFSDNRQYSVGASYNYGPLNIAGAYMQLNNAGSLNTGGAISGDNPFVAGRQRIFGGGVNYAFGPATVGFVFTQTMLDNATAISNTGSQGAGLVGLTDGHVRFTNYEVNGRYNLTPALSLAANYTYTDSRIDGVKPKFHQVDLQTAYALSKRTDVYLQGEYQHVSDLDGTGLGATINGVGVSSTPNQVSATVGLRHRF